MTTGHLIRRLILLPLLLVWAVALAGCGMGNRLEKAQGLATGASFNQRQIGAAPFALTVFERIGRPGGPATVYIEGDGLAYIGRYSPSPDPTPTQPLALRLAGADPAANVIYLARPCQYSKLIAPGPCPAEYWTSKRFAPEVIAAMNAALDIVQRQHSINGFHLVGYSGGAAVAVLVVARRSDVLSLRTVAGNLDNAALTRLHKVSPMPLSLDPADAAAAIAGVAQHHFIGGKDKIVTPAIYHSYRQQAGNSACIRHSVVADASHQDGWAERWRELLQAPVECGGSDDR